MRKLLVLLLLCGVAYYLYAHRFAERLRPPSRFTLPDSIAWRYVAREGPGPAQFQVCLVHGHRWRTPDGAVRDTQVVGPAESYKIRWTEDVPGTWLYHCHVESHMMNGMIGIYRVSP